MRPCDRLRTRKASRATRETEFTTESLRHGEDKPTPGSPSSTPVLDLRVSVPPVVLFFPDRREAYVRSKRQFLLPPLPALNSGDHGLHVFSPKIILSSEKRPGPASRKKRDSAR